MNEKCLVPSEDKIDCGHYGIKQNECVERGCCWRPSKRPNDPWCFTTKAGMMFSLSLGEFMCVKEFFCLIEVLS